MSVPTNTAKVQYTLSSTVQALPIPFYFLENAHIKAVRNRAGAADYTMVLGTDYTLTGAGDEDGGTMTTIATNLQVGDKITIKRNVSITQQVNYVYNDKFPAETHEGALDKLTMIAQQLEEQLNRAIRFPESEPAATSSVLALAASRAGRLIGFNTDGALQYYEPASAVFAEGDVIDVNSLAALKSVSVTDLVTGQQARMSGYNAAGDGGGGLFYYDSASAATANNGTVVAPNAGSGRWIRTVAGPVDVRAFGATCDGSTDDTTKIQAALDAVKDVVFPSATIKITDNLVMSSGHVLTLSPGTTIRQYTANKNIFRAVSKTDITINGNGGVLYGEGAWSDAWSGNEGHEDRGIRLIGCQRVVIDRIRINNCASAGISIQGGSDITIISPVIRGTHDFGVTLQEEDNFQNGIHIFNLDAATYGDATNIKIVAPDISGVAQGLLREEYSAGSAVDRTTIVVGANIHDIPGQHAFYIQSGKFTINGATLTNIALSGVKIQSGSANRDIYGFVALGVNAEGLGGALFEVACLGTGSLKDALFSGTVNGCEYGISINGKCQNIDARVSAKNVSNVVAYITGANPGEIDLDLYGENIEDDGVLIDATLTGKIRINAAIRNCNTAENAGGSGIRVESASADVELTEPDVSDTNGNMVYGLFNSVAGSVVKVRGFARFTGATAEAVRATGTIEQWPTETLLDGATGDFTNYNTVKSSQPMQMKRRSASASYVDIWGRQLEDESAFLIRAEICGKLEGSAQRAAYVSTVLVYRNGGDATVEGSADTDVSIASGSFAGAFQWAVSGSNVFLQVSSGGVANYDWTARVTVTPIAD